MADQHFKHPHDTPLSSSLRFLTELTAWVAGPWAASLWSNWLIFPALIVLIGLPSIFSTPGDKNRIIVRIPGPVRVLIELILFAVAATAPWLIWPATWAALAVILVAATIVTGVPRMLWLLGRKKE